MTTASFQLTLEQLHGLERRKDKLGLEGTRELLGALGDPHQRFRSVHVAGTNGKGSVCALVERALREAGVRTGLFTSPHLVDFRERIRVDGRWVEGAWLERTLERIETLPEGSGRTFFEICTALGFAWFAEQGVEIAVVEVGLGGRLDCTNVLDPLVSVVTTVGLDHTEILGDTIERIAAEKAGIIKPGVPVVTGVGRGPARRVIEETARARGAPIVRGGSPRRSRTVSIAPGLAPNAALALDVLAEMARLGVELPPPAVSRGLAAARWPGRFERCPTEPRLWWDGAHNPSGAMQLCRTWGKRLPPGAIALALSRDKNLEGFLGALRGGFAGATIVATRTRSERALEPAVIAARARGIGFPAVEADDVASGVRRALDLAGEAAVLLTGSLFAVGEAMEAFGGAPGEQL